MRNKISPFLLLAIVSITQMYSIFSKILRKSPLGIDDIQLKILPTFILLYCFYYFRDKKEYRIPFIMIIFSNIIEYITYISTSAVVVNFVHIISIIFLIAGFFCAVIRRSDNNHVIFLENKKNILLIILTIAFTFLIFIFYGKF